MCSQCKASSCQAEPAEICHRGERRRKEIKRSETKENTVGSWHRCFPYRARQHFQAAAARGEHRFAYENLVKLTRSLIRAFIIF